MRARSPFPSDEAATKLLFLALRNIVKDWSMPQRTWNEAANQLTIVFGERFTASLIKLRQLDLTYRISDTSEITPETSSG